MSKQTINIGASPNDGTGTPLRTSFDYTNQNFTELYTALGGGVGLPGATTQVIFNDGGTNLAGDAGLVYNKTTDALTVAGLVTAGSASITGDLTVDTSTLKVDSTNNRVGIGTVTPSGILHTAQTAAAAYVNNIFENTSATGYVALPLLVGASGANGTCSIRYAPGVFAKFGPDANDTTTPIYLVTNNSTTRMEIAATGAGDVKINTGNVVMGTAGKGIDFSAVTGGTGTATANVLNDYEEGTFTPTVTSVGGTGIVYVAVGDTGTYTKIGRLVTFTVNLYGTYTGTFSYVRIALPFTVGAVNDSVNGFNGSTGAILGGRTDSAAARFIVFNFQASGETGIYTGSYNV